MAPQDNKLSTTALAKKLDIPVQQLFATLKDYGWIARENGGWTLTPKGEFEGGSFQNSNRFGRYIVWPESLQGHQLLSAIELKKRITAAAMQRYYPRLHARQINRALGELGLQQHSILGWELTAFGRTLGGQQEESESSGAFYVTWPHEIVDHPVVHRELAKQSDQIQAQSLPGTGEPDLFDAQEGATVTCNGIDGHILQSALELRVCDWLYLAQLTHAYRRALPTEELLLADFYLPVGSVYIDCWGAEIAADQLSSRLRKREIYHELKLRSIDINAGDEERLDEVLGRGLLAFGIRC
ncbi:MAG: hypothetical protein HOC23_02895 [Halieaceae bacterium]|jgi:hypothetical protein|nr:hypothetical protein [Halieaceae bacterium]